MKRLNSKYKLSRYNVFHQDREVQYMWNTYSGALLKLDKSGQEYIHSFSGFDDGSGEFKLLNANGFIVFEQIDEFGRVCFEEKQALTSLEPYEMRFVIAVGMGCNYDCWYCFEKGVKSIINMTPEIANMVSEYICQQLKNNPNAKKIKIGWFGGEPLLYTDIIEIISNRLIKYTVQNSIVYSAKLVTNGRLLDTKALQLLQDLCVEEFQITIDGTKDLYCKSKNATSEDFKCVIDNICYVAEKTNNIKLLIRLNIANNDVKEAISTTDYLFSQCGLLGKTRINFAFVRDFTKPSNVTQEAYANYVHDYFQWLDYIIKNYGMSAVKVNFPVRRHTSCGLTRATVLCIGPSGEFYKCERRIGDHSKIIGNVSHGRFYNDVELAYQATVDSQSKKQCAQCSYVPVCMGKCADDRVVGCIGCDCETYKKINFKFKLLKGGVKTWNF